MYPNRATRHLVPGSSLKKLAILRWTACFSLLGIGCAGQLPPPGGPRDTEPPRIVFTEPDTGAVHVDTRSVTLRFSKYVDRRSVEESIFISPYAGDLEFSWSGKEVRILFPRALHKNTTYVLNVGTDVTDVGRENTRMASGFTLAFSTGDSIDHGYIRGRVFDPKPEGIMIFAYRLDTIDPDTLNPSVDKPEYIMQTGTGGTFTLAHLAFGTYRVCAVKDEYKNLLYDKEVDEYGVTTSDITLNSHHPSADWVWFRLSKEDTTRPFLSSVAAIDRYDIRVRFSEALDSISFDQAVFSLVDTLTREPVPLKMSYLLRRTPAVAGIVTAAPLDSGRTYLLRAGHVQDRSGNSLDTSHATGVFPGTSKPDTVRPRITVIALKDSARGVLPDSPLELEFSKPVSHLPIAHALMLRDSTGGAVRFEARWFGPADEELHPDRPLMSNAWYHISLIMDSVVDLHGNTYRDSTFRLRFQTLDLRTTGVLEGSVVDDRGAEAGGAVYLTASSVDLNPARQRTIVLEGPGTFRIDQLMEGKYALSAFRDADSSGSYTFGQLFPFRPSERFTVYQDTLKVRARWGVEGILMRFR